MGNVTRNFSRAEFACQCGCSLADPHPLLVTGLQEVRDIIGQPIIITSGCRCAEHNAAVGGVPDSQHLPHLSGYCMAADIICPGATLAALLDVASLVPQFHNGGIGAYFQTANLRQPESWLHLDVRRDGPARWGMINGNSCGQAAVTRAAVRFMKGLD